MPTVHLEIKGKVQGVFYRSTAKKMAEDLGLDGWVKNMPDGSVEATVHGTEEAIAAFINWARKGPAKAEVADVIVTPKPDDGLSGFQVLR